MKSDQIRSNKFKYWGSITVLDMTGDELVPFGSFDFSFDRLFVRSGAAN